MAGLIGLDWGTSSLRAYRLDADGAVVEVRARPWGIRQLPEGGFEAALAQIAEIKQMERAAEYGKWRHWYRGEWLVGIDETREMIEYFDRWIDDPLTRLPAPVNSNSWQAYYHIMHYEGDKSADVH